MKTSLGWKVPFREYYSATFVGWVAGCWACLRATLRSKLSDDAVRF